MYLWVVLGVFMRLRLVMLLVIGPLLALAGVFVLMEINNQRQNHQVAVIAAEKTAEDGLIGDLIHELQRERGFSAGFLSSKGQNFAADLTSQRAATDAVLGRTLGQVSRLAADHPDAYRTSETALAELSVMRANVDGLVIPVPDMASYYTGIINNLLHVSRAAISVDNSSRFQALLQARFLMSTAKERAGLERATGAVGIGQGFDLALHDRFVSLVGGQDALLAEASAALDEGSWIAGLQQSPEYLTLETLRRQLVANYEKGQAADISGSAWFQASSAWIDLLRAEEQKINTRIVEFAREVEVRSGTALNRLVMVAVAASIAVMLFAIGCFELMIRRIRALTMAVGAFTRGDFDVEIKGTTGNDELSRMARAVDGFKDESLAMRTSAQSLEAAQKQREEEQAGVFQTVKAHLTRLSDGDLTATIDTPFPPSFEGLRGDFNDTLATLGATFGQIADAAASIRNGAAEIRQSSSDLSYRTESQAATLEETAAALEEMTASIRSGAERTRTVEHTMAETRQEAETSGVVVQNAVSAMTEIEQSSGKISQIISVIDDIAFQTNLLALNAGVEAARAGEAGRGFAVVASEVRALAQRSSDAAMEIKTLIEDSSRQVDHGVELVGKAGDALTSIVERINHVSQLVSEIAEGAVEQSTGLNEINTGVSQLDQVTQQNAAMVEEATAAGHMLDGDATKLADLVDKFRISSAGGAARGGADPIDAALSETVPYHVESAPFPATSARSA